MRYALADAMIYVSHNRAHHNVGTCLWHVSVANHHCFKALETYRRREHCPPKKTMVNVVQCINALETCQRHVPTLWRYRFGKFDAVFYQEHLKHLGRWG